MCSRLAAVAALVLLAVPAASGAAPRWRMIPTSGGTPREGAALVYLPGANTPLLAFGCKSGICQYGETGTTYGDLEVLESGAWQAVTSSAAPNPRFGVAYAPTADGRALVFGGNIVDPGTNAVGNTDETWIGGTGGWTQVTTSTQPPALRFAAMAFDSAHGREVLFGGRDSSNGDDAATWAFNLANDAWLELSPGGGSDPPGRMGAGLAYEPNSSGGVVWLYGGQQGGTSFDDLWRFDCTAGDATDCAWTQVQKSGTWPPPLDGVTFTWDDARNAAVLFGGEAFGDPSTDGVYGDTWEWNGSRWSKVDVSGPSARYDHAATYDSGHQRLLVYGGIADQSSSASSELWSYEDSSVTTPDGGSGSGGDGGNVTGTDGGSGSGGNDGGSGGTGPSGTGDSGTSPHGQYGCQCQTFPPEAFAAGLVLLLAFRRRRA